MEKELFEQRKLVRDKKMLLIELVRQQVGIAKLKQRNINQQSKVEHRLLLPLLLVECQHGSKTEISQNISNKRMKMQTNRNFKVSDENLLFKGMGLSKTTRDEMKQLFKPKLFKFLCHNEDLISKLTVD